MNLDVDDKSSPLPYTLEQRLQSLHTRYYTLLCLLASIDVLGPLATDAHLPSLPAMTSDLHTSPSWIQFSVLSYSFILAISSLIGGYLSDKHGRKPITIIGLLFFIVGGYACAFTPNIWLLNVARIVQGFGGGISSIITSSVARDVFTANERMKILGILGSLRPFAIAIAPIFGGWIAEISTYSWRAVFAVTTSIAVLVMFCTICLLPETKGKFFIPHSSDSESVSSATMSSRNNPCNIVRIVCSDCILMTISGMLAFRMVAVFVFLNEFPYVAHHVYNYSEFTSGLLIGSGAIFLVIGASVSIAMRNMLKVTIMRMAAICALLSCLLLILGPILNHWNKVQQHEISLNELYTDNSWPFIVIPFCILTFSQGLNGPPTNVIALEPYPHIAGSIGSVMVFWRLILPSLVMMVLTQIIGQKTDRLAAVIIYSTMALMSVLCFILVFGGPCLSKTNVADRMNARNDNTQNRHKKPHISPLTSTQKTSLLQSSTSVNYN